jgi:hypothetical protein
MTFESCYMIFDDYFSGVLEHTKKAIGAFNSAFHKKIRVIGYKNIQIFVENIRI